MSTNRTLQDLAQEALDIQNASNLTGVVGGFHRALVALGELGIGGSKEIREHAISRLWADKIASLVGIQGIQAIHSSIFIDISAAYECVEKIAQGEVA